MRYAVVFLAADGKTTIPVQPPYEHRCKVTIYKTSVHLQNHRYVGRTFIMPGQAFRRQNVRKKLSAVSCVLEGRSVLLVDDSIVRGTTSREIVRIVKEAGARKVFFCSASPPVSFVCFPLELQNCTKIGVSAGRCMYRLLT